MTINPLFDGIDTVHTSFSDRLNLFLRLAASFGEDGRGECTSVWSVINNCEEDSGDEIKIYVNEFMAWQEL